MYHMKRFYCSLCDSTVYGDVTHHRNTLHAGAKLEFMLGEPKTLPNAQFLELTQDVNGKQQAQVWTMVSCNAMHVIMENNYTGSAFTATWDWFLKKVKRGEIKHLSEVK